MKLLESVVIVAYLENGVMLSDVLYTENLQSECKNVLTLRQISI